MAIIKRDVVLGYLKRLHISQEKQDAFVCDIFGDAAEISEGWFVRQAFGVYALANESLGLPPFAEAKDPDGLHPLVIE